MSFQAAKRLVTPFFLHQRFFPPISTNIAKNFLPLTHVFSRNQSKSPLHVKREPTKVKQPITWISSLLKSTSSTTNQQRRPFQTSTRHGEDALAAACQMDSFTVRSDSVFLSLGNREMEIPLVWLRDHCRCPLCFNQETHQKKVDSKLLERDLSDAKVHLNDSKNSLIILWKDGHESTFSIEEIQDGYYPGHYHQHVTPFMWDSASLARRGIPSVSFQEHMNSESGLRETISNLVTYGFTFVDESPANVEATQTVAERVGRIMPTIYSQGPWILSSAEQAYADTAYTNVGIRAHTDLTYYTAAAGIQIFHCLEHDGNGGETLLVDGFHAASRLRDTHPASFDCLTKCVIPHEFKETKSETSPGYQMYNLCTVLTTWPDSHELIQIRFNPYDRAPLNTLPADRIPEFYRAYDRLSRIIQDPANEFWIKLTPGRVLFIDNWRVMHGRSPFNGLRILSGCYLQRDEWISKARVMNVF